MSKFTKIAVALAGELKEIVEISGEDLLAEETGGELQVSEKDELIAHFMDGHWRYYRVLEKTEEPETTTTNS